MNWIFQCLWTIPFVLYVLSDFVFLAQGRAMPFSRDFLQGARNDYSKQRHSYKRLSRARTNAIKQDFLSKMGYTEIPDVTRFNASVEEKRRMLRLYRQSLEANEERSHVLFDENEYLAKQLYQFSTQECNSSLDCFVRPHHEGQLIRFDSRFPEPDDHKKETRIHSATLKLFKANVRPHNLNDIFNVDRTVRISIYQVVEFLTSNTSLRRLVDSKMVSLDSPGWEQFDVAKAVAEWHSNPALNLGLLVLCDTQPLRDVIDFASSQLPVNNALDYTDEFSPVLEVHAQEQYVVSRQRRAVETYDCRRGDGESRCCRYPLEIRFADIGWDSWILAPEGFKAYFCDGHCPHSYKMAHNFAAVQYIMRMFNPAAAPAPCCSASKLSPLTILHYDEHGHLKVSEHEDMIVQACKCT